MMQPTITKVRDSVKIKNKKNKNGIKKKIQVHLSLNKIALIFKCTPQKTKNWKRSLIKIDQILPHEMCKEIMKFFCETQELTRIKSEKILNEKNLII